MTDHLDNNLPIQNYAKTTIFVFLLCAGIQYLYNEYNHDNPDSTRLICGLLGYITCGIVLIHIVSLDTERNEPSLPSPEKNYTQKNTEVSSPSVSSSAESSLQSHQSIDREDTCELTSIGL